MAKNLKYAHFQWVDNSTLLTKAQVKNHDQIMIILQA